MTRCLIALGGNLGDVPRTFAAALAALDGEPGVRVHAASRPFRTAPVGADAGDDYRNAAALLDTSLSPADTLALLHRVEAGGGRRRDDPAAPRWGPRTLDLDLVTHGDTRVDSPTLTLPHPAAWYRRFVLDPACDVAADVVLPGRGTVRELRDRLATRPFRVAVRGDATLLRPVAAEFPGVEPVPWGNDGRGEVALSVDVSGERSGGDGRVIRLSSDDPAAALRDVLAAAVPDPRACGEVLWSSRSSCEASASPAS